MINNFSLKAKKDQILQLFRKIEDLEQLVKTLQLGNFDLLYKKQILVDISGILHYDSKTGIPRVIKSQINALLKILPSHIILKTIYLKKVQGEYIHYCCKHILQKDIEDAPIKLNHGDIIYNPDLAVEQVQNAIDARLYQSYKDLGVKILFLIHDILPIQYPQFFKDGQNITHLRWFENVISIADYLISTSKSGAKDLAKYTKLKIIPIYIAPPVLKTNNNQSQTKKQKKETLDFLIVGTIEPRKGHEQLLEAFEMLWQENYTKSPNLIIVGKAGWMMDHFIQKLTMHPQLNKKLYFKNFVEEEELLYLYQKADCVIVASFAEGFGLPLIEAAFYAKPLIVRDIPIFRELAQHFAYYFPNTTSSKLLAEHLSDWMALYKQNKHPSSEDLPYSTWEQNANSLLKVFKKL